MLRKAVLEDIQGICRVCSAGWRASYQNLLPKATIEKVIADFYNLERVRSEVLDPKDWNGWWVARDSEVVAAGGGGMIDETKCELFVIYVDPDRRGEGIGTQLLEAITAELTEQGATVQQVSTLKENKKGLPFYKARGFSVVGKGEAYGRPDGEHESILLERKL